VYSVAHLVLAEQLFQQFRSSLLTKFNRTSKSQCTDLPADGVLDVKLAKTLQAAVEMINNRWFFLHSTSFNSSMAIIWA
jgi:hypothetical protein